MIRAPNPSQKQRREWYFIANSSWTHRLCILHCCLARRSVGGTGTINVLDIASSLCTHITFEHFYSVFSLVVLSDDIIALGPSNSPVRVLDLASGVSMLTLNDECYRYSILAMLPNGNLVATTDRTTVCVLE